MKDTFKKELEFENFKRRNENDQLNILKYAAESLLEIFCQSMMILSVLFLTLMKLQISIQQRKDCCLSMKSLERFLIIRRKKIDAKGKPFDVHFHEALMQQPTEGISSYLAEVQSPDTCIKIGYSSC